MPKATERHMGEVRIDIPTDHTTHIIALHNTIAKIMHTDKVVQALDVPRHMEILFLNFFTEAVLRGVGYDLAEDIAHEQLKEVATNHGMGFGSTQEEAEASVHG